MLVIPSPHTIPEEGSIMANGHGGARQGAGWKRPTTREKKQFTLSTQIIMKLSKETNMSETVEVALMHYFDRKRKK